MKKFFVIFLMIGFIFSMSHMADAQPGTVEVVCDFLNGENCLTGQTISFTAGDYRISVLDGAIGTSSLNGVDLAGGFGWFWGMDISGSSTDGSSIDLILGDYSAIFPDFTTGAAAALNNSSGFVDFSVVQGHTANLNFFVNDISPRDNIGSLTVDVVLVPEPISSILFVVGGSTLAARRFMRRKKIDRQ